MKITDKIIEDVVIEIAGPGIVPLVKFLKNKKVIKQWTAPR